MTADQLEQEALKLPTDRRARLAERILVSLDLEAGVEGEWVHEVKRRVQESEASTVAAMPMEDASASAQPVPRLVGFSVRPEALDNFIEAWKAERQT